jgi:bla regulator protein blaR1
MQQSFMDILLTDAVAKAVCWTLVHSLWQGLLAALVAGAVILTTRKSAAVLRYNLLTADLVLFLAAAVGTFSHELGVDEGAEPARVVVVDGVRDAAGGLVVHARYDMGAPSMLERTGVFLNEHAGLVVMLWMVCLLVQLVRMTGGLYRIHRLRRHRVFLPTEFWRARMVVLMERLGIDKKVALLQSGSVTMPVTFGFLKPSILVPLGLLANLPAEQVETILLHELAHIRRSDYLANLLMHIGEAVFFFNPGVRWVAWLVRQEREACCDDLVLSGTRDRNSYFEALISFGEYRIGKGSMALPLGGGKSDLLWRIRRMLSQENKKLHLMEKTILSFGLMAVLAIGLVSMKGAGGPGVVVRSSAGPRVVTFAGRSAVAGFSAGAVVDTVPAVSGKKPAAVSKVPVEIRDTMDASKVVLGSVSLSVTTAGENPVTLQLSGKNVTPQTAAKMATAMMMMKNTMETPAPVAPVTAIVAPVTTIVAPVGDPMAPVTEIATPKAAVGNSVITSATNYTERVGRMTVVTPAAAPAAPSVDNSTYIDPIIADLKARGLIQSEDPLTFRLDIHELKVNGVQQPDEIYQAFKAKYFNGSKNYFRYMHKGGSIGLETGFTNGEGQ